MDTARVPATRCNQPMYEDSQGRAGPGRTGQYGYYYGDCLMRGFCMRPVMLSMLLLPGITGVAGLTWYLRGTASENSPKRGDELAGSFRPG